MTGSSEKPEKVVDAEACARFGVDILKRSTGGGTVLQTADVLNHSLITPAPQSLDAKPLFRLGLDLICAILAEFGIEGKREGTSDVAVGDRKISGNAQARRWKAVLGIRNRAESGTGYEIPKLTPACDLCRSPGRPLRKSLKRIVSEPPARALGHPADLVPSSLGVS